MPKKKVLIIGAGMSGISSARVLSGNGFEVKLVDKGNDIGGRLATKQIETELGKAVFDFGASYITSDYPEFSELIEEMQNNGIVEEWKIYESPKDEATRSSLKVYKGISGIRSIAKELAAELDYDTGTKIVKLKDEGNRFTMVSEEGKKYDADIVILTMPVPQALSMLENSGYAIEKNTRMNLEQVLYDPNISLMAAFGEEDKVPESGGLILNSEPIQFICSNTRKGISPGVNAVTIMAGKKFSFEHWETDDEVITRKLLESASRWVGNKPVFTKIHRWRYSYVSFHYEDYYADLDNGSGRIVIAGDGFGINGTEGAYYSGMKAAEYLIKENK